MYPTNSETGNSLVRLSLELTGVVERVGSRIVAIDARPKVRTSGVIWRSGVIVSTSHTVRRDEDIAVTLHDGSEVIASFAGRDPATDLSVLRIDSKPPESDTAEIQFAEASELKPGNLVIAVGRVHPAHGVSASLGILTVAAGKWRTWRGAEIDRLISPDVSIFVGFSGGALIDMAGRIIGINTTGLGRGAGVTIPASTVDRVLDQLLASGHMRRPYLGLGMQRVLLPDKLREKFNLTQTAGLIVLSVEADAPADNAGITIGDVLLTLGEAPIVDTDDVQTILDSQDVGVVVKTTLFRGGELTALNITLGERPVREKRT